MAHREPRPSYSGNDVMMDLGRYVGDGYGADLRTPVILRRGKRPDPPRHEGCSAGSLIVMEDISTDQHSPARLIGKLSV